MLVRFFLPLLLLTCGVHAVAAENVAGHILKAEGDVYIESTDGQRKPVTQPDQAVNQGERIVTAGDGRAVVEIGPGDKAVMDQHSIIQIKEENWFKQLAGKIYYKFRKLSDRQARVESDFVVVGIRGTTFFVDTGEDSQRVALKEGQLSLASPDEAFELHRRKEAGDFKAYQEEMESGAAQPKKEFEAYREQVQQEWVEYKKEFLLEANKMVSFSGKQATETELTEVTQAEFQAFEDFAAGYLKD